LGRGENLNKNKKINKFLIPVVAIIIISVLIIPSSTIIAGNLQTPTEDKILSVWMNDVDGQDYSIEKIVPEEKYEQMNVFLTDVLAVANNTVTDNSPGGKNITNIEWDDIAEGIIKIIDLIKAFIGDDFPYEVTKTYILSLINLFHGPLYLIRQPLLSIGIGFTWIPFYDYETFLGRMIRPVFIRHLIGFSATARLNPFRLGFPYWYFGYQRVRTFLFRGLLINFADLGINRIFGPQLLIGYGVFTGFVH
jgi:hypothetical protein